MSLRVAWLESCWRASVPGAAATVVSAATLDAAVPAVLFDSFRRATCFDAKPALPRALASVVSATVAKFLPHNFAGLRYRQSRCDMSYDFVGAMLPDGRVLIGYSPFTLRVHCLVSDTCTCIEAPVFDSLWANGDQVFDIAVAPDGFVYVLRCDGSFVVLMPDLQFHSFLGKRRDGLYEMCVGAECIFVIDTIAYTVLALQRDTAEVRACLKWNRAGAQKWKSGAQKITMVDDVHGEECVAVLYLYCRTIKLFRNDGALLRTFEFDCVIDITPPRCCFVFRKASRELILGEDGKLHSFSVDSGAMTKFAEDPDKVCGWPELIWAITAFGDLVLICENGFVTWFQ